MPAVRRAHPRLRRLPVPGTVFLNLAYGRESEKLFLAYVAGLLALGLVPKLALQVADSGRRLDHIRALLHECEYSVHDLHHVGEKRWNMILELGMAIECSEKHRWFVLDSQYRRAIRALSDLNGTDIFEHRGTTAGVFRALLNIFSRPEQPLTVTRLEKILKQFVKQAKKVQRSHKAKSPFERFVFERLVIEARRLSAPETQL